MLEILLGIIVVGVFFLPLPLLLSFWLWYFHDRHIKQLREKLLNIPSVINESNRGRGVTTSVQETQIKSVQRPVETELAKKESARQLFLDRAHLISIFKIK